MSSLDFPLNPTNGQTYTLNGVNYEYNSTIGAWLTKSAGSPLPSATNAQILFNDNGLSNGSFGLVFDKSANTLIANAVKVGGSAIPSGATSNLAFDTANAAYAAANNVGPQIAPTYNTANAAFGKANTALQNTSGVTFAGNLSVTGNVDFSLGTSHLKLPVGTTAQRPVGANGMIRFNSTTGYVEYYDTTNSQWIGLGQFTASGGTETTYTSGPTTYKVHTFTSSGTFTVSQGSKSVSILLIAGGGGAGYDVGGGGGAGGCISTTTTLSSGAYAIVIGSGGTPGTSGVAGSSGSNSTGFGYTAYGGGGGGSYPAGSASYGVSGGSGGGGGANGYAGGSGTAGQGYAGGTSASGPWGSAGGGGAGGAGSNGVTNTPVSGGSPLISSINGTSTKYAGGGYGTADSGAIYATGYDYNNTYQGYYGYGGNGTGTPNTSSYNGNPGICIIAYAT